MTSERLSNQSSDNFNKIINIKLLFNNIRQHKVLIIVTAIILFFARPLVQIISLMNYYNGNLGYYGRNITLEAYAKGNAESAGATITAAALILAIVIALNVTSYMHDKKPRFFLAAYPSNA